MANSDNTFRQRPPRRIEIYDTTLRDGTQGQGISLSLVDKIRIIKNLDDLGVDYIEGGYPLSNPKDEALFAEVSKLNLNQAKVCAFGMTRRRGIKANEDPGMKALVNAGVPIITIVGKTWDLHVKEVLSVSEGENLDMIRDSVEFCHKSGCEVFYDAEHFFDGYRDNPQYSLSTLSAATDAGATRLILCDTNGGSLPDWVKQVVQEVKNYLIEKSAGINPVPGIGIHTHNDSGVAVANTLAAVEAGAVQVQGTINGIGERCGNVDLTTVVPNLRLKMGYDCLVNDSMLKLTETSRFVYELANMNLSAGQPFVGSAAFAHKGGMHVHAVQRITRSYEHISPEQVGNTRRVLVSELSGASNIAATLGPKFKIADDKELQRKVLQRVQDLENQGYQFEAATASFELLLHEVLDNKPNFWKLDHYRCVILRRNDHPPVTEATVKVVVDGQPQHHVAEGDGPVNALDGALRKCLAATYPQLANVHLRDYRVRVVNPRAESAAKVRAVAEFTVRDPDLGDSRVDTNHDSRVAEGSTCRPPSPTPPREFTTTGVNENIVDASWQAITDAFVYYLIETKTEPRV